MPDKHSGKECEGGLTRSRCRSRLPLAFASIFLVVIVVLTGCGLSSAPAITEDQAMITVHSRLLNLAQSPEAKEYVTIFLDEAEWEAHYFEGVGVWGVGITPTWTAEDLVKRGNWFKVSNADYFFRVHWDEPYWRVYDDGRVEPVSGALMVESDIDQLNSGRILK